MFHFEKKKKSYLPKRLLSVFVCGAFSSNFDDFFSFLNASYEIFFICIPTNYVRISELNWKISHKPDLK
jgi:hypothetical protein